LKIENEFNMKKKMMKDRMDLWEDMRKFVKK
jgi:hypothetical protein